MRKIFILLLVCLSLFGCKKNKQEQTEETGTLPPTVEVLPTPEATPTPTPEVVPTIKPSTPTPEINLEGVKFLDGKFDYDGNPKSLEVTGLPEGCSVTYTNNGHTDPGSYVVTAVIKDSKGVELLTLTARLTINFGIIDPPPAEPTPTPPTPEIDLSGVLFESKSYDYDGTSKFLWVENLPEGCKVVYDNNNQKEVGTYEVVAVIQDSNGITLKVMKATLTITEDPNATPGPEPTPTPEIDLSGVLFESKSYDYDGTTKSLEVINVPAECIVSYENNDQIEVGTYEVVAIIKDSEGNVLKTLTATLTINAVKEPTPDPEPAKLSVPTLYLDAETGVVSWSAIEGATHYNYIINGGEIQTTLETSVTLSNESNISVQAANDDLVSDFSVAVTYFNTSDVTVYPDQTVYVYFHNTGLDSVTLTSGEKVERPTNLVKENYTFDNFYADPYYTEVFDFNTPIYKSTVVYAKWNADEYLNAYYWIKADPKMTSSVISATTSSTGWRFIPLLENTGSTTFKEFYATVNVVGASETTPCQFIVMDGIESGSGRTYWKKGDTDFTIKSDGVYNIYFSTEHQYAEGIHIYVSQVSNTALALASDDLNLTLVAPVISVDGENNIARWDNVSGATEYEVVINNGTPTRITNNYIELPKSSHISVRAIGIDGTSKWSLPAANINYIEVEEAKDEVYAYFMGYESIKLSVGESVNKPTDPTKNGYTFGGWYLDIAYQKPATFPYVMESNTVFYAKWNMDENYSTKEYYKLVDSNGSTISGLVWNLDNYDFYEYKTSEITLNANTNYYVESLSSGEKWGPYQVSETANYKVYFSPDYMWNIGSEKESHVYFAKQVMKIYFTNNYRWSGTVYAYIWDKSADKPHTVWPGITMTKVETNSYGEDIYMVEVSAPYDMIIFSCDGKQTVDISLADAVDGKAYYISGSSGSKYTVGTWTYN